MAVGLAGLRAARLAHVSTHSASKRNQLVDVKAHSIGDADDHFEITLGAGYVAGFFHQLEVAAGVSEGSNLLVGVAGRKNHVGQNSGFGQEHVLNDHEALREGEGIDGEAGDRV